MSASLLSTTVREVAAAVGGRLPAVFSMDPGDVVVAGDVESHVMPVGAVAVRWPVGAAQVVLAVTADTVEALRADAPDATDVELLTPVVAPTVAELAPLLGAGAVLGEGTAVDAASALAEGPGDPVSVALDDAGTHRATVALRLVVDDLSGAAEPVGADTPSAAGVPLTDVDASQPADGVPLPEAAGPAGAGAVPLDGAMPGAAAAVAAAAAAAAAGGGAGPRRGALDGPTGPAHPADFASFESMGSLPGSSHPMAMLSDVEMAVTAELGRTRLSVREVLGLSPGSIIELDRSAGSPVDVVVNGTLIARGEVVVIDEEFGIRITEIVGLAADTVPAPLRVAQ